MKKIILSTIFGLSILLTSVIPTQAYTIQPGDTLSGISQIRNVAISRIVELNPSINNINLIFIGQKINLGLDDTVEQKEESEIPLEEKKEQVKNTDTTVESVKQNYQELVVEATAYTAYCKGCSGITKTGINLRSNPKLKVIAVDPKVIPLGSKVWVEGYGEAIAGDTGGAIKGNKIDVFIPSKTDAYTWGRKQVKIKVYN